MCIYVVGKIPIASGGLPLTILSFTYLIVHQAPSNRVSGSHLIGADIYLFCKKKRRMKIKKPHKNAFRKMPKQLPVHCVLYYSQVH